MESDLPTFEDWLKTRPLCVQKLAKEFGLGTRVTYNNVFYYILGYCEDDRLIFSSIDPAVDYDAAMERKIYVCADHLRGTSPIVVQGDG